GLEAADVEERGEKLGETVRVLHDQRRGRLEGAAIAVAGREPTLEKLGVAPDHRDRRMHVMPGHREDVLTKLLEVALRGDIAEHDHAALEHRGRRTQDGCPQAEDAPLTRVELDVDLRDLPARADRIDGRHKRLRDLARRVRPLLDSLRLEGLTEDEARSVEAKKLSGC